MKVVLVTPHVNNERNVYVEYMYIDSRALMLCGNACVCLWSPAGANEVACWCRAEDAIQHGGLRQQLPRKALHASVYTEF